MTILYLVGFVGGLLLGIRVMLFGVERPRDAQSGERSFRVSPAIIVAFAMVFGGVGYVLSRQDIANVPVRASVAVLGGVIAAAVAARLVRMWWKATPEHDVDDERYVLQGHVGRVTKPIRADVDGEVVFAIGSEERVLRARSFDESAMAAGTEVVIERVEGEVAYVEAWRDVEKRL